MSVIHCKWRRCGDGYQLTTGLWWVAYVCISKKEPKKFWWKASSGKSGYQDSLELAKLCAVGAASELGSYCIYNDLLNGRIVASIKK